MNSPVAEILAPYEKIEALPPGRPLFCEGAQAEGVYYLHSGEVDLRFSSPKTGAAKSLLLAGEGELLGLTSVMSGRGYDCSATTRTACVAGFVEKNRFFRLLDEKPALWLTVLRLISANISACWECMRNLGGAR